MTFIAVGGPGPRHVLSTLLGHGGLLPRGLGGLVAALPVVFFSMGGSEIATVAAAESADPAANVARAVRSVALRIALFYVCSVTVIVAIVPWNTVVAGQSPFRTALEVIGIPGSSQVMFAVILTAVLSSLNSSIYIASRML